MASYFRWQMLSVWAQLPPDIQYLSPTLTNRNGSGGNNLPLALQVQESICISGNAIEFHTRNGHAVAQSTITGGVGGSRQVCPKIGKALEPLTFQRGQASNEERALHDKLVLANILAIGTLAVTAGQGAHRGLVDQIGGIQEHGHQPLVFDTHGQDCRFQGPTDTAQTVTAALSTRWRLNTA